MAQFSRTPVNIKIVVDFFTSFTFRNVFVYRDDEAKTITIYQDIARQLPLLHLFKYKHVIYEY